MYKIVGGDGQQYGPVTADQLRQWAKEGRVTAATQALADGAAEWKPLGALPEFAALFGPSVPPIAAPPSYAPPAVGMGRFTTFPVAVTILLHFVTCSIFGHIWFNLMHGKLPQTRPDDPSAGKAVGFLFIPFFNYYWIFFTYVRLCERLDAQRVRYGLPPSNLKGMAIATCIVTVIPYINILIALPIMQPIFFGMLQSTVNQLARASSTIR
jgi:hypothetical protein